jgi:multicomponent Na+:H+ antiporter subunit D
MLAHLPVEVAGRIFGESVVWIRADALARVFATAFAVITGAGLLFALREPSRWGVAAAMVYAAGAIGVALAGDVLVFFGWWEVMAVASAIIVFTGGRTRSHAAAWRYLLVHAAGGACLLIGLALHLAGGGGREFGNLTESAGETWILLGFLVNAAVPPLHGWLSDAYPEASPAGAVFLSALTTKAAVYALARGFAGTEALAWWGAGMALYGVVFAVLENDIRRLLAYHIVSQVGYMVCGVGLGSPLALDGAAAHALSHILYKGLLFMSTGAVLYVTGRSKLTELGGLWRAMPATLALYTVGAFSISGVPLFNGFVSKSMVVAAAEEQHRAALEWMLLLASVGTFLHTGLKLPWFTFFAEDRGVRIIRRLPWNMTAAMAGVAALCIGYGIAPHRLYTLLPNGGMGYEPYTAHHVIASLQLLIATAVVFALLIRTLGGEPTVTRDMHLVYAACGRFVADAGEGMILLCRSAGRAADRLAAGLAATVRGFAARRELALGWWIAVVLAALVAAAIAWA